MPFKPFIYEPRGFESVGQMNEAIISNWNEIVKPEDEVYVLGDIMLKDNEKGIEFPETKVVKMGEQLRQLGVEYI